MKLACVFANVYGPSTYQVYHVIYDTGVDLRNEKYLSLWWSLTSDCQQICSERWLVKILFWR